MKIADRETIIALARDLDPSACWATNEADDNCLLIASSEAPTILDLYPESYEDPNDEPTEHTRVVFPTMEMTP